MMKLLSFFLIIAILFLQAIADASTSFDNGADSLTNMDKSGDEVALYRPRKINCNYACARRCRKASRKKICNRACKTCCARCHCVPPGTYGNKNVCPCYARLTTHGHRPKCP